MTRTVINLSRWIIIFVCNIWWITANAAAIPQRVVQSSQSYEKTIEWRDDVPIFMSQAGRSQHSQIEVNRVSGFQHYQVFDHPEEASVSFLSQQWLQHYMELGYQQGFSCSDDDCPPSSEWQQHFAPRTTDSGSEQAYLSFTNHIPQQNGYNLETVQIYFSEIGCCVRSTWRVVRTWNSNLRPATNEIAVDNSAATSTNTYVIHFDLNDDQMSDSQIAQLSQQILGSQIHSVPKWLDPGLRLQIQGHTDNTGTIQYNQLLSQQRAKRVADLLHRMGVPRNQITVRYFGATKPVASNATQEGRQSNRRVTINVIESH